MTDVDKFNGQSFGEEIANSITHGIGLIASIVGLIFLILRALVCGNIYSLVSGIIYGVSLIILYFSSTFYHAISKKKIMAKTTNYIYIFQRELIIFIHLNYKISNFVNININFLVV